MRQTALFLTVLVALCARAQQPKLVVGVVVDQMRYDYLYRYRAMYGDSGWKRLLNEGTVFHRAHYSYIPTYTGPGHATVYTGTTPAYHGIIGNSWFDRELGRPVYCVSDTAAETRGSNSGAGQMSPHRMYATTLGDAMQLFYGRDSKVFGVSMKDRGAVLPAGHMGDGAYWFDGKKYGHWISSSYYGEDLPRWVQVFNQATYAEKYLEQTWELSPQLAHLREQDQQSWEGKPSGKQHGTFPYDLAKLAPLNGQFDLLKATPMGNDLTLDFALQLLQEENLGQDAIPDLLTLSFSGTDYVGHRFGTHSLEVADTYLRLDRSMARLLNALDEQVGTGNYVLFLTSDHGAVPPPEMLKFEGIPGGLISESEMRKQLEAQLEQVFGVAGLVSSISNEQVFLSRERIQQQELHFQDVVQQCMQWLRKQPGVDRLITGEQLCTAGSQDVLLQYLQQGYHPARSGDVVFSLLPGWAAYGPAGSTHGSGYAYDTHVPLIFYGTPFPATEKYERVKIEDIVPTISTLLKCTMPNAVTGQSLLSLLR